MLTTSVACQVCGWWIWEEKFVTTTENVCGNQRVLLFCPMFWVAGVLWVWMFLTVHYPLYSSDLRLGWQNRILMTAGLSVTDWYHSLQSSNTRSLTSPWYLLSSSGAQYNWQHFYQTHSYFNLFMPVVIRKPKWNWILYLHYENLKSGFEAKFVSFNLYNPPWLSGEKMKSLGCF